MLGGAYVPHRFPYVELCANGAAQEQIVDVDHLHARPAGRRRSSGESESGGVAGSTRRLGGRSVARTILASDLRVAGHAVLSGEVVPNRGFQRDARGAAPNRGARPRLCRRAGWRGVCELSRAVKRSFEPTTELSDAYRRATPRRADRVVVDGRKGECTERQHCHEQLAQHDSRRSRRVTVEFGSAAAEFCQAAGSVVRTAKLHGNLSA